MLAYLLTLVVGFWLGVSGFLYLGCYFLEEILDLPQAMVTSVGVEHASTAHARLKRLVQRVIEEAMALPALLDYSGTSSRETTPRLPDFDAKTYEDLLATAILNKVIDRYQQDYDRDRERSSGIHSESASPSGSHLDDEIDLSSNCLDKRALESGLGIDRSTPSQSSIEPLSRDGSVHSGHGDHFTRGVNASEKLKNIPTVYSSDEEYPEEKIYNSPLEGALATIDFSHKNRVPFPEYGGDIIDIEVTQDLPYDEAISDAIHDEYKLNGDIHTVNNTWEENWLFQKKRLKTTQSVPVPMLVPNSNSEYKAMIGDRDAEDTTDLSDAGSDEEDSSLENDIKKVLVNSKTIIGGKNLGSLLNLANDFNNDNEVTSTPVIKETKNDPYTPDNEREQYSEVSHNITKAGPTEAIAMLVEIDSGPLTKAEFKVAEIHRGFTCDNIDSIVNKNSQTEFAESKPLDTLNSDGFNQIKNTDLESFSEATNLDVIINDNELNSLQQKESEYSETIAVPVQRHLDSLKRITRDTIPVNLPPIPAPRIKDTDAILESNVIDEEKISDCIMEDGKYIEKQLDLPPDSVAVRERQKWLNAVPMPNNPYSAEAIEKRLSQKNSSLFDIITNGIPVEDKQTKPTKDTQSPPKTLQETLAEDIPVYKRYGRDYYIKEAKQSAGSRAKSPYLFENDNNQTTEPAVKNENPVLILNGEQEMGMHRVPNGIYKTDNNITYSARPVIIGNEGTENDKVNDAGFEDDSHVGGLYLEEEKNSNDNGTFRTSFKENKNMLDLNASDTLSDSISSMEDNTRIYNLQSGKVTTNKNHGEYHDSNSVEIENVPKIKIDILEKVDPPKELTSVSIPKVKDLAKMFTSTNAPQNPKPPPRKKRPSATEADVEVINKNVAHLTAKQPPVHMHSLTARSISKEFREELKQSMPTIQKLPGGVNEVPNGIDVPVKEQNASSRPNSPQPVPGTLKNKLAFFERLNKR